MRATLKALLSLRQIHLLQQRSVAGIAKQRGHQQVYLDVGQVAGALLVGPLQPFERLLLLAAPRINLRDLVGPPFAYPAMSWSRACCDSLA